MTREKGPKSCLICVPPNNMQSYKPVGQYLWFFSEVYVQCYTVLSTTAQVLRKISLKIWGSRFLVFYLFIYSKFHENICTYRGIYTCIKGLDSRLGLYWSSPRLGYCTATIHTYIAIDMHNNSSIWLNSLNNFCRQMKGKTKANKNSTHIIWSWVQYMLLS